MSERDPSVEISSNQELEEESKKWAVFRLAAKYCPNLEELLTMRQVIWEQFQTIEGKKIDQSKLLYFNPIERRRHHVHRFISDSLLKTCQHEDFVYGNYYHSPIRTRYAVTPLITKSDDPSRLLHDLYVRYEEFVEEGSKTGIEHLPETIRKYLMFVGLQEYEMQHGYADDMLPRDEDDGDEDEYQVSMVGRSCWTSKEKKRFFLALDRCGRRDALEISKRVVTKTPAEVASYINFLDKAAKGIQLPTVWDEKYSAREMSPWFIVQEELLANSTQRHLETESFAKHQALSSNELVQKSMELFEIWNMSSLTRIFSHKDDMVILSSTLVYFYQLLKRFVYDIIMNTNAELFGKSDKTVSRSIMNHVIAKRKTLWVDEHGEEDRRLEEMDVKATLEPFFKKHDRFSCSKSASFLAKRRRRAWTRDVSSVRKYEESKKVQDNDSTGSWANTESEAFTESESENEAAVEVKSETISDIESQLDDVKPVEHDDKDQETETLYDDDSDESFEVEDDEDDEMLQPFDSEDELQGCVWGNCIKRLHEATTPEEVTDNTDIYLETEEELEEHERNRVEDKKLAKVMRQLDAQYEAKLIQALGMCQEEHCRI